MSAEAKSDQPTFVNVLTRTAAVAPLNFLPIVFAAFVFTAPTVVFRYFETRHWILVEVGPATFSSLGSGVDWAIATFTFYGAIAALQGKRVGFRDCLVEGVRFALPILLPVFILGFAVGTAFQLHALIGLALTPFLSLMPITWAIEKRHPLRAVRLALNDLASHGLLIAAVNFVIVGWILLDYTLWQSGIEFYKRWPGDICP